MGSRRIVVTVLTEDRALRSLLKAKLQEDGYEVSAPRQPATAPLNRISQAVIVDLGASPAAESPLLGAAMAMPNAGVVLLLSNSPLARRPEFPKAKKVGALVVPLDLDSVSSRLSVLLGRDQKPTGA